MSTVPAQGFNVGPALQPSTVTASGNSGIIAGNQGLDFGAVLEVTQVFGTNPTFNLVLQESLDNGATWEDVWHFEQMTAAGSSFMPPLRVQALHRYLWTVAGTLPSFTFSVVETGSAQLGLAAVKRFFDYTPALLAGTINATSAAYRVDGATVVSATVTLAAGGTPGDYAIDLSPDGVNWYTPDTQAPAVPAGTVQLTATQIAAAYARVRCTVAATGQTGTVVSISAR